MKKMILTIFMTTFILVGAGCFNKEVKNNTNNMLIDNESTKKTEEKKVSSDVYVLSADSSVSYIAQKEWFKKPTQQVVGTNTNVGGTIKYITSTKKLSAVTVEIDPQLFSSGSKGRDRDVAKLFKDKIKIKSSKEISDIDTTKKSHTIPLDIQINNINKTVMFEVQGTVNENDIVAVGSSSINLQDFGIKAPSVLGLYTVNDKLGIKFNIKAKLQ